MAKHAYLSASASHRWLKCPPPAKLCAEVRPCPLRSEAPLRDDNTEHSDDEAYKNSYFINSNGNKGIACGLNILQKTYDGKSREEDDFATDDEDNFLN